MGKGNDKGGGAGMIAILSLILIGLGGWNYHRNYQIELAERSQAKFSGYETESLLQLAEAYRAELTGLEQQYQKLRGVRSGVRATTGVEEGVREFERVQRASDELRSVTTELGSREARVREIETELSRRHALGSGLALHFGRLTGLALPI